MRTCAACATSTDESGRFCPECGAALIAAAAASAAETTGSLVGFTVDGFEILAVLGGGSFGTVYRARQVGLDRPVALKVPTHEIAVDPIQARRFAREARSAARVHHPGVVAIYAVGEIADGRPYLAMQLIDGEPLDRILEAGPIPARRALRIARAIASALSETHAVDVVHRDLKPSNIMWRCDRNGDDRITLVDFGIAVCKPGNADATRLTAGGLIGTPHYMSPEQAHGEVVDARADLYALGCVLFELVTGNPPFDGSGFEVLLAHLGRPAPAPSDLNPDVPEVVDRVCARLLAKKPDERPASADVLVKMLDAALAELDGTRTPDPSEAPAPVRRRTLRTKRDLPDGTEVPKRRRVRRLLLGAGAIALAITAGGFAAYGLSDHRDAEASAEPTDTPNGPVDGSGGHRRTLVAFSNDGELVLHALVPDPIPAGREIRPHLEVLNKLGQPVVASQIVATITDDHGVAKGLSAPTHGRERGHYTFTYAFPQPGTYVVRVFPPSIDSSFELTLRVE